jgi:Protein of unknown function (DUF3102)
MQYSQSTSTVNASGHEAQIARPLKILVPLIKDELSAAHQAGLEHYRHAGELLLEAKSQFPHGAWSRWLTKNFELSHKTANRYMGLARKFVKFVPGDEFRTLKDAIGERPSRAAGQKVHHTVRIDTGSFLEEFRKREAQREAENKRHRDFAFQLIDLGYRALATRHHPDHGGSTDAMACLNRVRDELKSFTKKRGFV